MIDPEGAQPYYLFIGNVVPYPDFQKMQFNVHKTELDGTEELLEKYVLAAHVTLLPLRIADSRIS